jgi:phosphoribosyl 1,2-cyclic phosphodiesterase
MKLELLGVRGSTPSPGPEFVRYGGHTACVAVVPNGADEPTLVLDAGTGIRSLTSRLGGRPYRGAIMLSHLHWDHAQGIPFFVAGDRADSEVELYLPAQDGQSARDLLARMMSPPSFPIEPEGLLGRWSFHALEPGRSAVAGFEVTAAEVTHKGGRTFGYRVTDATGSFAYLPDHAPALGLDDDVRQLVAGVDVLLHDAQFVETERAMADAYGHATIDDAVELATAAEVGALVLFHHSPARTDDQLDVLAQETRAPMPILVARQGQTLAVPV